MKDCDNCKYEGMSSRDYPCCNCIEGNVEYWEPMPIKEEYSFENFDKSINDIVRKVYGRKGIGMDESRNVINYAILKELERINKEIEEMKNE